MGRVISSHVHTSLDTIFAYKKRTEKKFRTTYDSYYMLSQIMQHLLLDYLKVFLYSSTKFLFTILQKTDDKKAEKLTFFLIVLEWFCRWFLSSCTIISIGLLRNGLQSGHRTSHESTDQLQLLKVRSGRFQRYFVQ